MRTISLIATAVMVLAPAWVRIASAQAPQPATVAAPAAATASSTPTTIVPPVVAEEADRLLRQMGEYIGSAEQFTFHADITFDHVLPSGQKLQYAASQDVALQRPGGLYVEWSGDLGDRQFWYDGKSVTLYDPATPFYASEPAPADIDAMLRTAISQLGFSPPLSDLLYRNPYRSLRDNLQYGFDLGLNDVAGRSCRTLGFVEKDIDWQIWIDPGPQLTPCKLVITYKTQPSQPQFTAVFTDWDFAPRIAEPVFMPELPPGLEKIPFAPVVANATPK
jgi:hypothetical protein